MGQLEISGEGRQAHLRVHVAQQQLYVRVGGRVYRTVEWSFGGLLIENKNDLLPMGALIRIDGLTDELAYKRASSPQTVDIRARVIRVMHDEGLAALSCLKLDDAAYQILHTISGDVTEVQANQA